MGEGVNSVISFSLRPEKTVLTNDVTATFQLPTNPGKEPGKVKSMWISARTATTLAAAALLLVMAAVAAPLIPRAHLPSLPEEQTLKQTTASKYGAATAILETPERVRAQRMSACDPAASPQGGAQLKAAGRYGTGPALEPKADTVQRLTALLKDPRIVPDPRAATADVSYVVRLVRGTQKVDVMVDPTHDRLVVAVDQVPIGSYAFAGLHKEFSDLGEALFPVTKP